MTAKPKSPAAVKKQTPNGLVPLGWREWVVFPDFDNTGMHVKVDTGAKTSAIHAGGIRYDKDGDQDIVSFLIYGDWLHKKKSKRVTAQLIDRREIKSSNGKIERRPVIRTTIEIAGKTWPLELTLTNRKRMKFPVLLGREVLQGRAMVAPGQSYLSTKPPKSTRKTSSKLTRPKAKQKSRKKV